MLAVVDPDRCWGCCGSDFGACWGLESAIFEGSLSRRRSRPPQVAACGLLVSIVVLLAARGEFQLQPHHPPPTATRVLCIAPSRSALLAFASALASLGRALRLRLRHPHKYMPQSRGDAANGRHRRPPPTKKVTMAHQGKGHPSEVIQITTHR